MTVGVVNFDVPVFKDTVVPKDDEPAVEGPELTCEVCGVELTYGGRGRKPKRCELHRKSKSTSTRQNLGGNDKLAAQAVEALLQVHGIAAVLLMVGRLPETASALSMAEETFREQAYAALLTDPALCRSILRAGTTSGKLALLIGYAMLGAAVVPVAVVEVKQKQKEKTLREEMIAVGDGGE